VTPTVALFLGHVHPGDRRRIEATLAHLAARHDVQSFDYQIVRDDDVVRHFQTTVAVVDDDGERPLRVMGSVQDVTAQDSVARKLAAHAAVSKALDEWEGFEAGAGHLLAGVAVAMNLPFGVLWVPLGTSLEAKRIWHRGTAPLETLADATREWHPGRSSARLGRAWVGRQPAVSDRPDVGARPLRRAALREAGIVASIVIPAVAVDETVAVLEFLSHEQVEASDQMLSALNGIGHEVGYFLGQRRGELVDPVLTPRELEVLQLAARALSAPAIAEELLLSRATVKRHFEGAYARLGVSDRAAAVGEAMRQGLID
jgi:DNA-binding CsgD family transcriptional regulator